jgi:hypothetical protein
MLIGKDAHAPASWITNNRGDGSVERGLRFVLAEFKSLKRVLRCGWRMDIQYQATYKSIKKWDKRCRDPGNVFRLSVIANTRRRALHKRFYCAHANLVARGNCILPTPELITLHTDVYGLMNSSCDRASNQTAITAEWDFETKCCIQPKCVEVFLVCAISPWGNILLSCVAKRHNCRTWSSQPTRVIWNTGRETGQRLKRGKTRWQSASLNVLFQKAAVKGCTRHNYLAMHSSSWLERSHFWKTVRQVERSFGTCRATSGWLQCYLTVRSLIP